MQNRSICKLQNSVTYQVYSERDHHPCFHLEKGGSLLWHWHRPLTSLSEEQRTQATSRFTIIHPALEKEITQAEVARTHQISLRTVQRWIKSYREQGLAVLADSVR